MKTDRQLDVLLHFSPEKAAHRVPVLAVLPPHQRGGAVTFTPAAQDVVRPRVAVPHVARWLAGLGTSLTGDSIYLVALAWVAVQTTTAANVGWILVAGAIPQATLLLLGGVFVDRLGPKRVILVSDSLRVLIMVVFALVVAEGTPSPVVLGALAAAFGVVDGFFLPAVASAPRYLGSRAALTRIMGAKTVVARAAEFLGAPLASWLLIVASAAAAFWANAGLFALSVLFLLSTRMMRPTDDLDPTEAPTSPGAARTSVWSDLAAGARVIAGQRTLLVLLLVIFVMELGFSGPITAGVPLLANETGWGVRTVGWVLGGFGLGAAASAGYLTWHRGVRRTGLVVAGGLTAMGSGVVGLGVLPAVRLPASDAVVVAGALGLVIGLGSGFFGTLVSAAVLHLAPLSQVGRVMSALSFSSLAAVPVTFALTGLITHWSSARVPFWIGGGLVLVAAALALLTPDVRQLGLVGEPAVVAADPT